ncbi:hypothetical protein [Mycobacterium triplex]|uniref:Transmembrane protein n=1 Tax=Mycobacterium triplex TaxID=47839 RepID=A0A024JU81_9MYCO|nr:hypothetical protein [Mycobacterium triplex]CDO87390.1 transmembrane protein [Mycobacterium triplex]
MSAVGGIPGLSELLAWPTDHLTEAADHWETVGESSYGVVHQVWRDATSVDWQGESADALHVATHADLTTTSAVVDQLQTAASVARSGASDLHAARSRVRYAVEDALTAGFQVHQDLSVTNRRAGGSGAQRAARSVEAQALAADIRQRAARLVTLDAQVARNVTAVVSGIRDTFAPIAPSQNDLVCAVDNHTVKQAPPMPPPPDPKDMTATEARAAWAEVNREIADYNSRCGRTFILPNEQAAYDACIADKGPLVERQAQIRDRLGQLGIPVEGEDPSHPGTAEPPFPPPTQIDGYTDHGRERIEGRDGHGVNDNALRDAVEHPIGPPQYAQNQYGGNYTYVGEDATVILGKDGKVITAWANSRDGWRNP